jgi:hypothetical protein
MIRNESDIIDLWLEATSKWSDLMVIVDHQSEERNAMKLREWCLRNKAIYLQYRSPKYSQAAVVNSVLKILLKRIPDHVIVVPLDADEFINSRVTSIIRETFSKDPGINLNLYWRNAYPDPIASPASITPETQLCVSKRLSTTFKVCTTIKNLKQNGYLFSQGGHYLIRRTGSFADSLRAQNAEILHVPLRSLEQYENKICTGTKAYKAKNKFKLLERKLGLHWEVLNKIPSVQRNNYFPVIVKNYGDVPALNLSLILNENDIAKIASEHFNLMTFSTYLETA